MVGQLSADAKKTDKGQYVVLEGRIEVKRRYSKWNAAENKTEYVTESAWLGFEFFGKADEPKMLRACTAFASGEMVKGKLIHITGALVTESWGEGEDKKFKDFVNVETMETVRGGGWRMTSHQCVQLSGNLAKQPEFSGEGTSRRVNLTFGVYAGGSGEKKKTYWAKVALFGKDADNFSAANTGDLVFMNGEFKTDIVGEEGDKKFYLKLMPVSIMTQPKLAEGETDPMFKPKATADADVPGAYQKPAKVGAKGKNDPGTAVPNGENEFNDHGNPPVGGGQDDLPF